MSVDFIKVAGQLVRVTSLKEDAATGTLSLVVIARGSVDRQRLSALLDASPVLVEVEESPARSMDVTSVDQHVAGAGEAAITRFAIDLAPAASASPGTTDPVATGDVGARLDRIEARLDEILTILQRR